MPWNRIILIILIVVISYHGFKTTVPKGASQKGEIRNSEVEFIYDLTYEKNEALVHEQHIFPKIKKMIKNAQNFIVIDMFLFNDDYDHENGYENISGELTDSLIEQKKKVPGLQIVFITDEINIFYGSYPSKYLERLRNNGIQVVITDLEKMRDSNPLYSGLWRPVFKNLDTKGEGYFLIPLAQIPLMLRYLHI
ncbi:hypothetical protein [Desulfonispora thiosulfatigenes]|nr:hypothetical protein [Desulfonispora thiosulfatigenes]